MYFATREDAEYAIEMLGAIFGEDDEDKDDTTGTARSERTFNELLERNPH